MKIKVAMAFLVFCFMIWATTFIFVQPIEAERTAAWMFKPDRLKTNIPFICSADSISLRTTGHSIKIPIRYRTIITYHVLSSNTKIITLPYIHFLYLFSIKERI